jgi:hypothetical protein
VRNILIREWSNEPWLDVDSAAVLRLSSTIASVDADWLEEREGASDPPESTAAFRKEEQHYTFVYSPETI